MSIETSSGNVVLNDIQWSSLMTFKRIIIKLSIARKWSLASHPVNVHVTFHNTQVYISKKCSQLVDLSIACIDRQVIKFSRLQHELVEWRYKCFESKCLSTPPNTNAIDFDALLDELTYKNSLLKNKYL